MYCWPNLARCCAAYAYTIRLGTGTDDALGTTTRLQVIEAAGFLPYYVGPIRFARNLEAMAEVEHSWLAYQHP